MRIIIIEDEPLMAEELRNEILKADDSVIFLGVFGSVSETVDYLAKNELPDLFFSDIQLSDGLSFEIFERIESPVPVIFCTAFDEYALDAFKANGIDYLLKPFDNSVIPETINKYKRLIGNNSFSGDFKKLFEQMDHYRPDSNKSLIVHQGQKIYPIKYADIRILFLKDGITYLVTNQGKRHIVNGSLERIEHALDHHFYRANRQVIIHRDAIGHISNYFSRKLLITPLYKIDMDIIVSKANVSHFLRWLESR